MKQKIFLALGCMMMASGAWATDYTLTLYADGCSESNTFICSEGQQLSVNATPMAHRHLVAWSDGNTDNPRLVTMNQNLTLTAIFAADTFSLTVLYDEVMGSATGAGEYPYGSAAYITATPNYGYHFKNLSYQGRTYSDENTPLVVSKNDTVSVTFEKNTYRVTASGDHGYIRGTGGYLYLDSARLTAEPYVGYGFDSWTDGVTDNPRSVFVTQDTTLSAHFVMLYEGECGKTLTWKYNKGVLTISGTGDMYGYYDYDTDYAPWKNFRDSITTIILPNGLTSIGSYAFSGCSGITSISIPTNVTKIGYDAFKNCSNLTMIMLGNGLTSIGEYAFTGCTKLRYITCMAEYAPTAYSNTFPTYNAILKVPCDVMIFYQGDDIWGQFKYIQCIEAEEAVVTTTTVVPSANDATFAWPTSATANTYVLNITKNGVVFCTLTFNANGQLLNIAFAPCRDGAAHAPEAELTATGYQFTVTGLESGSTYAYTLDAKDAGNNVVANYSGTFTTTGGMGFDAVSGETTPTKILRDGQVLILRGDRIYDLRGQEVK